MTLMGIFLQEVTMHINSGMNINAHRNTHIHTHAHTCSYIHANSHTYTCTGIHTQAYMHIHVQMILFSNKNFFISGDELVWK